MMCLLSIFQWISVEVRNSFTDFRNRHFILLETESQIRVVLPLPFSWEYYQCLENRLPTGTSMPLRDPPEPGSCCNRAVISRGVKTMFPLTKYLIISTYWK